MTQPIIAASVTQPGTRHINSETPNQDSVYFELLPDGQGIVAAVSDGAGSASRAKEGSQLAAKYAVKRAVQAIRDDEPINHAVQAGLHTAREAIKHRAHIVHRQALPEPQVTDSGAHPERAKTQASKVVDLMADYHCTLVLVAWVGDEAAAAQIGDGAAIAESAGTCKMLTIPQRGEYANETYFVTEPHFRQTIFNRETSGITAIMLFTDGLQNHAVDFRNKKAHDLFAPAVIAKLREPDESHTITQELGTEIRSTQTGAGGGTTDDARAGEALFQWLTENVGRTDDDMSLIVAARLYDG